MYDNYEIIYKGKTYYVVKSSEFIGESWVCKELNINWSNTYHCIDAVVYVLQKLECEDYIIDAVKNEIGAEYFMPIADRYESKNMSVEDAENKFNKRYKGIYSNEESVTKFDIYSGFSDDDYSMETEKERIKRAIRRHIGWRVDRDIWNHNNYIERQHMCVVCKPAWGQIEPQWYMRFRDPDMLGLKLDLDKIIDDIRLEMANEELEYINY